MMKVIELQAFGNEKQLSVSKQALPEPTENQVIIKVKASTISATDTIIRRGMFPPLSKKPPFVLGYDVVGIVDQVGSSVTTFKPGDPVAGLPVTGSNAGFIVMDASDVFTLPDLGDISSVATLPLYYLSAYQMLHQAQTLIAGKRVLVHAATGSVGQALLQLGQLFQLEMVGTGSQSKHSLITQYGAQAIDYRRNDYTQQLKRAKGKGFDAVFDCTNHASFRQSFNLLAPKGALIIYGLHTSATGVEKRSTRAFVGFGLQFLLMLAKVFGWNTFFGNRSAFFYDIHAFMKKNPERYQQDLNTVYSFLAEGKINPTIGQTYSLTQIPQAHNAQERAQRSGHLVYIA